MAGGSMRLDKFLTEMNQGSRSEVKQLIKKGRICVNGEREKRPEYKVCPDSDRITLDEKELVFVHYVYLMFHKPGGCVSATEDHKEKTVLDYIQEADCPRKKDLFPVGRLDKDTEGLLLLTNDGQLSHRLLSPKKHVEKKYYVRLQSKAGAKEQQMFREGMDIGDEQKTLPARLELLADGTEGYVYLTEGRYHQVKRMFQACGNQVKYLKRLKMGSLTLDEKLKPGEYRHLTKEELEQLQK